MEDSSLVARASPEITAAELGLQVQADKRFHESLLPGILPLFAQTVRSLPDDARLVLVNYYLLRRIIASVDRFSPMSAHDRHHARRLLLQSFDGNTSVSDACTAIQSHVGPQMPPAERELLQHADRVLRVSHTLSARKRRLIRRHLRDYCAGCLRFERLRCAEGLPQAAQFLSYCDHSGASLAELATTLLCSGNKLAAQRRTLLELSQSGGRGIRIAGVLGEIWSERERGACWLPRDLIADGHSLNEVDWQSPAFRKGIHTLSALALYNLQRGVDYVTTLPRHEQSLRRSCIWPLALALLTLHQVNDPRFGPRRGVRLPYPLLNVLALLCSAVASHDRLLRLAFTLASWRLPRQELPAEKTVVEASPGLQRR